ncbi:hypothetical protein BC827DRAFT_904642 [Russula dissimulans]|jgi:hypothetical protein|nr:hypothetical protein BC827DRAFT_904642 [Russula dissimulans]
MLFFHHNTSSPTSDEVDAAPNRRRSTTISMIEEEFGICELPQTTRFGGKPIAAPINFLRSRSHCLFLFPGLPARLRILPPKRRRSSAQAPEPRRNSSFLTGSWETVWGCDHIDSDGSFVEPPLEEDALASASDGVPGYGGQDNESDWDHDVSTPTLAHGAPWSTDGEITPPFSSTFPNTPNPSALKCELKLTPTESP